MSIATASTKVITSTADQTSLWESAKQFLKGEYNGPNAILIEGVLGLVPGVGQAIDARDIILGLATVSANPANFAGWFELLTALIGIVPGGGDLLKRALRQVHRGVISPDAFFDMLRKAKYGDPEALIKRCLDFSALQKHLAKLLGELRANKLLDLLPADKRRAVLSAAGAIERGFAQQLKALEKWVDELLKKQPNSSAHGLRQGPKKVDKPAAKGSVASKARHAPKQGAANTARFDNIARQGFGGLKNKAKGILGEHIADYHCIEIKGWGGSFKSHDHAGNGTWQSVPRKLNDEGIPCALTGAVRGRGIDGVWRTNRSNGKPYAIVEAKAYASPVQSLGAMLHDVYDKNELDAWKQSGKAKGKPKGKSTGKSSSAIPHKKKTSTAQDPSRNPKEPAQNVMQMSHTWIKQRLGDSLTSRAVLTDIRREVLGKPNYTRHVFLISAIDAYDHVRALVRSMNNKPLIDDDHAKHTITHEFTDRELEIEEKKRANKVASKSK